METLRVGRVAVSQRHGRAYADVGRVSKDCHRIASGKWEFPNLGKSLSAAQTLQNVANYANPLKFITGGKGWTQNLANLLKFITGGVVFVNLMRFSSGLIQVTG